MLNLWKWYQQCLNVHPVKTQVISSGLLWGLGDVAAQSITFATKKRSLKSITDKKEDLQLNLKRVGSASLFGLAFFGPVGHFWYEGLDHFITRLQLRPNSIRFIATKVAADSLIFGTLNMLIYFTYMGLASGKSTAQVKEDVKRDFIPGLAVGAGVWPAVQVANFRFVPVRNQLLFVNIFCLLDSSFLSWLEQQGDAPWKRFLTSSKKSAEDKKNQE